jgi:RNA:NAD 2'-phosphotransferase (TPT1/KptA family)
LTQHRISLRGVGPKQGLLGQGRGFVHLSPDLRTNLNVSKRHGWPVIFAVQARRMYQAGFTFDRS